MAKKELVKVLLSGAVVLGAGRDAREHAPGATVGVTQAVADELVFKGAGALVAVPEEASNVSVKNPAEVAGAGMGTGTTGTGSGTGAETGGTGAGTTTPPAP